jgi:alcohol dehydrogenase (cytochrome c)
MFVNSLGEVQALDAANGTLLWRYRRDVATEYQGSFNSLHRSFAIFGDNLYLSTSDRHVIALEAKSGRLVWDTEIVPGAIADAVLSAGPFAADGVIIQGVSAGPACPGGCYVVGLDPQTGKELWRFNTVARPGEPGGDQWNGLAPELRTGAASWVAGSYDPDLDLYYFGTGQTYGVSTLLTPGKDGKIGDNDAPYTDSTIALRPRTGKMVWYHQHLPGDVWDLDEVFERTLVTLPVDGKPRQLVLATGKMAILDALDRRDGRYVFSKDFGMTNLVTAIDPATGRRSIDRTRMPVPNRPVFICPSAEGARSWTATAYDPTTQILFVPLQANTCMQLTWLKPAQPTESYGKNDLGWYLDQAPGSDGKFGRIVAVDMNTRKTLWEVNDRALPSSSLLATAGGVVFTGSFDRYFRALDARSGEVLWKTRLNAAPNATPVTYTAEGKQFVAITTGVGGPHASDSDELIQEDAPAAPTTTIMVFGTE